MEETQQRNKMSTMPMGKLLTTMSVPIMLSMLVQALYNIVDSIFVTQYSENALAAVSLAFPIQTLMIAVAVGTGVGINSLLSRRLGEKNFEDANRTATNGVFLGIMSWLVFAVLGLFFSRTFFEFFTKNQEIIDMGHQYLLICTVFSFGVFVQIAAERIMQATGKAVYNMISQGTGAIVNIILDPILIFGWLGLPQMGAAGAAIATVIGQISAMIIGLYLNMKKNPEIHMSFRHFRPDGKIIWEIYKVGIPSIVMQSIISVMTLLLNKIIIVFSETAVSVLGVYFKLQNFVFMPIYGMNNGLIAIIGYNYGAKDIKRIKQATKLAVIAAVIIMAAGTLLFQLIPAQLLSLFDTNGEIIKMGVPALQTISLCFVFAGFSIVCSSIFQAIGNAVLSLIMSVTRQLIVIVPAAYALSHWFGLAATWYAFPISEIVCTVLCIFLYRYVKRKYFLPLGEEIRT